ncbi:MAG: TerB family tellurite resistance protein [Gammaproteobacteria bacterium]|nr:TerB family tellurite resistance protein [Gammaproteobacteria bacterium]MDH3411151.1 TerB family tellurite resistance protein [Gammaproteobacteria bacterium]
MLKAVRDFFEKNVAASIGDKNERQREHAFQLATAALLMEISRADREIDPSEREAVVRAVKKAFELDHEETKVLVELAEQEAEEAISLYEFTRLINENFDHGQKQHVVEMLWQVAFADGHADEYEVHLIRRIADLMHVPHRGFIRAKLKAESEMKNRRSAG